MFCVQSLARLHNEDTSLVDSHKSESAVTSVESWIGLLDATTKQWLAMIE
jgi:hypothetical protein